MSSNFGRKDEQDVSFILLWVVLAVEATTTLQSHCRRYYNHLTRFRKENLQNKGKRDHLASCFSFCVTWKLSYCEQIFIAWKEILFVKKRKLDQSTWVKRISLHTKNMCLYLPKYCILNLFSGLVYHNLLIPFRLGIIKNVSFLCLV